VNELWDWPMRPPEQIQANCVRCHTDVYDIKEAAPVVYEGRKLFATLGCVNCHQMDSIPDYETRKVGPDLRHVTSKLSPEFINTWVWSPKAFRPSTKMPHFFMQENNSSDEEIRRTRQEVRAITEYLVETATPLDAKYAVPDGITGDYERGKALFLGINGSGVKPSGGVSNQAGLGCLACHANLNEEAENWIVNDLVLDQGLARPKAEAAFAAMTYDERQMYCVRHFEAPAGTTTVSPTYNDDAHTPKPVFMHHGPELSGVGTKLLASRSREQATQWLFQWLKEPKHYSESTVMPQLRVTDQEALDLAAYLLGQTRQKVDDELKTGKTDSWAAGLTPVDPDKLHELISLQLRSRFSPKDADTAASDPAQITSLATDALTSTLIPADEAAKRVAAMSPEKREMIFLGKKMIGTYGCMSCHAINGTESLTNIGTNLSDWGQKQVSKLDFGYLDPAKIDSMPATTHITVINGLSPDAANLAHGDLPAGPIGAAVEVGWPHVEETRTSWITQKLHNTRIWDRGRVLLEPTRKTDDKGNVVLASGHPVIADSGKPYDKLRMPMFYLSDDQINALTTFVLSNRDHLVSDHMIDESVTPRSHAIAKGRALVELYNCVSCHQIEGNVAQIQQYFLTNELTTFAPPSLRGEGNKIQPQWLYNFFTAVEPIRTLPTIRMPTFPWQETQTNNQPAAVLDYFGNASLKEAAELNVDLAAIQKYVDSKQPPATPGAATQPAVASPNAPRPGDDWWQQPSLLAARQHLLDWALAHKQITEIDVDFSKAFNVTPAALNKTYNSILFKARFTANLYACPFPFVDTPKTNDPPDRFKTGEQFFAQMTCLTCHVLGDPAAPGAVAVPKGPNLSLSYRRLQARWIRAWIQEPPIIQVGTNMPQAFSGFFPSTGVYLLHGQTYPEALNMAPEVIADEKAKYGKTADEQTSLLMDFLFAAGPTGHSTILSATRPAAPAQPPPP
jgi:cytochrome c2